MGLVLLALTAAWNVPAVRAQEPAPAAASSNQDGDADLVSREGDGDVMQEMTDLLGKSGIASNRDVSQNLSAVLRDPNVQSLMRSVLDSTSLDGQSDDATSRHGLHLPGLLRFPVVRLVVFVVVGTILLVRVGFAVGVLIDARGLVSRATPTLFMGPELWAAAVLLGGLLVVALYWLLHRSTLSRLPSSSVR